jgi:hypothetical protein
MIGTDLSIQNRVYIISLPKFNLALFSKDMKLPSDKGIVKRIHIGRDKGSTPINPRPKMLEVFHTNGWKVGKPMVGIDKTRNFLFGHHLHQNGPLSDNTRTCLTDQFGLASLGFLFWGLFGGLGGSGGFEFSFHFGADFGIVFGEVGRTAKGLDFRLEFIGRL